MSLVPPQMRFGSEVYAWFVKDDGRAYPNRLDHRIDVIAQAGFSGVQPPRDRHHLPT